MRRIALLGLAAAALLSACEEASQPIAPPVESRASLSPGILTDRFIVVLESMSADADGEAERLSEKHGGQVDRIYRHALKGYVAEMTDAAADQLRKENGVALVERDAPVHASVTQTNATWGLDRIDQRNLPLNTTYTYNASGAGVSVYVLDTGIRTTHVEFGGRAAGAFTAINDGNGTNDCDGHGTHVSGTIGGSTWGVAKSVALYAVRVLDCTGSGTTSGVIAGIDWVTANAVKPAVANMSLGGSISAALDAAVKNSIASGVTYAISAGNSGVDACLQSPARVPEALTVGATNSSDSRASFSNYGTCVDIFAPGVSITSSYNTSNTATAVASGTSMASPHAAGVAALYLETQPTASPSAVIAALASNASVGKIPNPGSGSPNLLLYSVFGGPPPPATVVLAISEGNNQTGPVNTQLPIGLWVVVTDGNGTPIKGAPVTFAVTSGGGSLNRTLDSTGYDGRGWARWTLGPTAGTQTVQVTTPGASPVTFTATAIGPPPPPPPPPPAPTLLLLIDDGNNQTGPVNTQLPIGLWIKVTDTNGVPLKGVQVTFAVTSGGGSLNRTLDSTGYDGRAFVRWTLGPNAGPQTVEVTAPGANPVTFTATAVGPPPPQPTLLLTISEGNNQTGPVNTQLPIGLWIKVTDANGVPLKGVQVTFTVASGGGTLTRSVDSTGYDGRAFVRWTLGPNPGVQTVDVSTAGANPVTFSATAF